MFHDTPYGQALRELRKENAAIRRHLRRNGGNATLTAKELDLPLNRVTKIKKQASIATDRSKWPRIPGDREAEKKAVREALEAGTPVKRIAREVGTPESTVRLWRNTWRLSANPRPE